MNETPFFPEVPEEPPVPYSPLDEEITSERLRDLGVKVFRLQGWELMTLIIGNLEYFQKEENGIWFCSCGAGIARSVSANRLLKLNLELPVAENKTRSPYNQGMDFFELMAMIAQARFHDGLLSSDKILSRDINRLGLFMNPDIISEEDVLSLLEASFLQTSKDSEEIKGLTIFLITDHEGLFRGVIEVAKQFTASGIGLTKEQVIQQLAQRFNSQIKTKMFDYRNPGRLFE